MRPLWTAVALVVAVLLLAGPVLADPLTRSPLPKPRPGAAPVEGRLVIVPVYFEGGLRPRLRPGSGRAAPVAETAPAPVVAVASATLRRSPLPRPRPLRRAPRPATGPEATPVRSGSICGVGDIRGATAPSVRGRLPGCGVRDPVRVTSVAGVPLSRAALMDCTTAKALRSWVENGVKPGVGRLGGGVGRINVIADYSCRTINNRAGAAISEHGKGKAIDISGITLQNGKTLDLKRDWNRRSEGAVLKRLHRAACGPFRTVLGPEADRYHLDHFHFDTKSRRNPYCR